MTESTYTDAPAGDRGAAEVLYTPKDTAPALVPQQVDARNLDGAAAHLATLMAQHRLPELYAEIHRRTVGWPARDIDRCTMGERLSAVNLADELSVLLGVPGDQAEALAVEHLLRETRRSVALDVLAEMARDTSGHVQRAPDQNADHNTLPTDAPHNPAIARAFKRAVAHKRKHRRRAG